MFKAVIFMCYNYLELNYSQKLSINNTENNFKRNYFKMDWNGLSEFWENTL